MEDSFIIHACAVNGNGKGKKIDEEHVSKVLEDKSLSWIHLDANSPETRPWLKKEVSYLDNIVLRALLAEETRPRIMEFETGYLLILRGVNLNENSKPEDMISIRLWVDENRIISLQKRPLKATKDIYERLLEGKGPKDSGDFIAMLAARLLERMEPIFLEMDEHLDNIEEQVIEEPDIKERQAITVIRKQAIMFRRHIAPQRDVISYLRTSETEWLSAGHRRKLQDSQDRVVRYIEDLDTIRERSSIVKDELASALSDKMNKNMYVLSVIAAIFLPLGFFTGLLGINVGGIPGADNSNSFWIFCVMLGIIVALQVAIFKKLKWF